MVSPRLGAHLSKKKNKSQYLRDLIERDMKIPKSQTKLKSG
jgi:hypothetical protein